MNSVLSEFDAFVASHARAMVARLSSVKGSSPRAEGTSMVVAKDALFGTIGGGALEYMVIDKARQMLRQGQGEGALDVPLGPEIGQCCGGRVGVSLKWLDAAGIAALRADLAAEEAGRTPVYIFGAGHVGRALGQALALLPVRAEVIDTRGEEIASLPNGVAGRVVAMPEAVVRSAPAGSAFVILTHDHALDFLIAAEALARDDAVYVGMVGSRTKRARFASWYLGEGGDAGRLERLVLPIGQQGLGDKRPAVIGALAAAEIMVHIGRREVFVHTRSANLDERGAVHER